MRLDRAHHLAREPVERRVAGRGRPWRLVGIPARLTWRVGRHVLGVGAGVEDERRAVLVRAVVGRPAGRLSRNGDCNRVWPAPCSCSSPTVVRPRSVSTSRSMLSVGEVNCTPTIRVAAPLPARSTLILVRVRRSTTGIAASPRSRNVERSSGSPSNTSTSGGATSIPAPTALGLPSNTSRSGEPVLGSKIDHGWRHDLGGIVARELRAQEAERAAGLDLPRGTTSAVAAATLAGSRPDPPPA